MASVRFGVVRRDLGRLFSSGGSVDLTDADLWKRFTQQRDEAAFETIVQRHGGMVHSVCRGILRDANDVQDAFQATFLVLVRKTGAFEVNGSLAGWLHRVAYHVAIQLNAERNRRRSLESRAEGLVRTEERPANQDFDRISMLHEEVGRLPEKLRTAVVLCHFHELSHEQAAQRLGWTVGTVRGRVARGRALLRTRLRRRGFDEPGGLFALSGFPEASSLQAPASWTVEIIQALSTPAFAGTRAWKLADTALRSLGWASWKGKLALPFLIGLLCLGTSHALRSVGAGGDPGQAGRKAGLTPREKGRALTLLQPVKAQENEANEVEVKGRVVDPDQRPVANCEIWCPVRVYYGPGVDGVRTQTDAEGRFTFKRPRRTLGPTPEGQAETPIVVFARAQGFGPAKGSVSSKPNNLMELTLQLAKDDLPIEGRVVDLEGKPVARAVVETRTVWAFRGASLGRWLEQVERGNIRHPWEDGSFEDLPLELTVTTDEEGRFRLQGIGRDRIVHLSISGPTMEKAWFYAMTRPGADVRAIEPGNPPRAFFYRASKFEHAAAPTKPVVGVVRDKDTKQPLPGVKIQGVVYQENVFGYRLGPETVSDVDGHYRLVGLPKADAYRIFAFPSKGQPYPNANLKAAATSPALEEVAFDVELKRGILVRGRLTDQSTGLPVVGVVSSFAFGDDPHVKDYPGFAYSYSPVDYPDVDGRFEVVALPGRGLIAASASTGRYLQGVGSDKIRGLLAGAYFPTLPADCTIKNHHRIVEINLEAGLEAPFLEISLHAGSTRKGKVFDPEGRPLTGVFVAGLSPGRLLEPMPEGSSEFHVVGMEPKEMRRLTFVHQGWKLAASLVVNAEEQGDLKVRLQPSGSVRGRIVDSEGQPMTKVFLIGNYRSAQHQADDGSFARDVPVDDEGGFEVDQLVPGLRYEGRVAETQTRRILGSVFKGVRVGSGETKDVGDVRPVLEGK